MDPGAAAAQDATRLATRFGGAGALRFEALAQGLVLVHVATPLARASLCLQGAQLLSWQPCDAAHPVIWLSPAARFEPGRAIRGGIPVCWPWFGPHGRDAQKPSHGFARVRPWHLMQAQVADDGCTLLALVLRDDAATHALWPHAFELVLRLRIGRTLQLELATTNRGSREFEITQALHTYLQVGAIEQVRVEGLAGVAYADACAGGARGRETGVLRLHGEFDRGYVDAPARCAIVDPVLGRRLGIEQRGAHSTVVWNPWAEKALRLGDLGPDGWRGMLCVESGNILENAVRVAPAATHRLQVDIEAGPLAAGDAT